MSISLGVISVDMVESFLKALSNAVGIGKIEFDPFCLQVMTLLPCFVK